mgnify:CR=1 FL=1
MAVSVEYDVATGTIYAALSPPLSDHANLAEGRAVLLMDDYAISGIEGMIVRDGTLVPAPPADATPTTE